MAAVDKRSRHSVFSAKERDLAFVKRWGITRNIRSQSVAEHSFYVSLWAFRIAMRMYWGPLKVVYLMEEALLHDDREVFSGDLPSPYKAALGDKADVNLFDWMLPERLIPQDAHEVSDVRMLLKLCDLIEAMAYIAEEQSMGNTTLGRCWTEIRYKYTKVADEFGLYAEIRDEVDQFLNECRGYQAGIAMGDGGLLNLTVTNDPGDEVPF